MEVKSLMLDVSASSGKVSAEYIVPENAVAIVARAHGAGAGMNHSFMIALAKKLAESGIATFRFNFPFECSAKTRILDIFKAPLHHHEVI